MNILREVRKIKQKNMPTRVVLIIIFSVMLIVNTYAWISTQKNVKFQGLEGNITAWDVSYYVNSEQNRILDKTQIFTIEQLYPGMPQREDVVHIYNIGNASTILSYDVVSVKVFGQEVLDQLDIQTEEIITTDENGSENITYNTTIFSGDTEYPFDIRYTYDKTKMIGQYEEGGEYADTAQATLKLLVNWTYNGNGTESEKLAKDALDTHFGKSAYAYYQNEANDPSKAIEVKISIKSSMVHPDDDPDYPYDKP